MFAISDETRKLYSTFVAYRNDIDIYTEDEDKNKEFYTVLFNKLLDSSINISEITPLGCSENVLKMCRTDVPNGRKKIFIIDGDVRLIHGKIPKHNNLFVLSAYCIENFLIDKDSVVKYIYMNCGTKSIQKVEQELDYNNWLNNYCEPFMNLFFHFSIIDEISENFNLFSAYKFFNKNIFDKSSINSEINSLKNRIVDSVGVDKYENYIDILKQKWSYTLDNLLTIISGKDYLIPITLIKAKEFKRTNAMPSLDEAKIHLVHLCDLSRLKDLRIEIERIAKS